ncbi:hypothetical protein Tco_0491699 [Tanacetum coccineum]
MSKVALLKVVGLTLVRMSVKKEPNKVMENNDAPIIEDWVSDDEEQDESMTKPVKKTVIPTAAKIEKPVKKSVRPRVVNTARSNRTSVNAARANRFNAVKRPLIVWVWRLTRTPRSASITLNRYNYIDARGRSKFEITSIQSIDPPLSRGYTLGSGEDSMKFIGIDEILTRITGQKNVEPNKVRENNDAPIIEEWVSDDEEQDQFKTKPEKKTVILTAAKIEKRVKKSVRYAEMYRSQSPRGNQRNWNGQKSNQLGSEFVMYNNACFICGSFNHVQRNCTYHQKKKVVSGNNYNKVDNYYYAKTTHHRTHKNVTPRAILLRSGIQSLSTAKPRIVNTARSYKTPVNTVRPRVINTARQNKTLVNAVRANGFNAVKPSACWVWRPIKPNSASITLNRYNYIDARGRSNLMEVMLHLEEIAALKKRIQRLERRKMSRPTGLKRLWKVGMSRRVESSKDQESLGVLEDASKQGRSIEDIGADVDVSLVDETQKRYDDLIFDSEVLEVNVMHVEAKVDGKDDQSKKLDDSTACINDNTANEAVTTAGIGDSVVLTTSEEITLAQTLIQIKAAKPKVVTTAATTTTTTRPKDKGVVVQEPSEFRVPQETQPSSSKDKGKGIMIEPEVPLKRKDQIALDEQIARDIQAKLDAELLEEQKLARKQEEEANIALIESWENTQAMMEADRLLAERL